MDSLPKDDLLEYNENTLKYLRKQYNFETKEDMEAAVDVFEEWLKKQMHFLKKDYSREYLERIIILHKGSVERAKTHMDKLCTLRTLIPHFFEHCNVKTDCAPYVKGTFTHAFLPKLTADHHRVYLTTLNNFNLKPELYTKIYQMSIMFAEYIMSHDYCDGFIMVADLRNVNILDMVREMNIFELRQIVTVTMEGFGLRIKGIHLITTSSTIDVLTRLMKQIFSTKIGSRIFVHKTLESLCESVPKEILPQEYGGYETPLESVYEKWLEVLSKEQFKEHMKMMNQARTNETLRLNDTIREEYLGIAGTFRTLSVD